MAGQRLKNLEGRNSKTFQLGIDYTCDKFQWSPIKKVLWSEVKQNIQWLFKRTCALTFRRAHFRREVSRVVPTNQRSNEMSKGTGSTVN